MVTSTVTARDLYPSARDLFREPQARPRTRRLALAWLLAGALAAVVGQRILTWLDRNI